jgi:hypothetical protein
MLRRVLHHEPPDVASADSVAADCGALVVSVVAVAVAVEVVELVLGKVPEAA